MVTDPLSIVLLGNLPGRLVTAGAAVWVISSPGRRLTEEADRQGFQGVPVVINRSLSPIRDLITLVRLIGAMRRIDPDLVDAGTPKAGLLGMVAARLTGVPVAIYTMRGMRLETESGLVRHLLLLTERLAARLADEVLVISPSLRQRAIDLRLAPSTNLALLGAGSLRGVDLERFAPTAKVLAAAARHRTDLDLGDDPVIGFVGRLSRSKGVRELLDAFDVVRQDHPRAQLVLVGDIDGSEPITRQDQARLVGTDGVHQIGWTADTPEWFAVMDFVALPSKREGFPSVPIEAAGLMKPCVAFLATGTVDAVVDGQTGLLVTSGDVAGLAQALGRYLDDPDLCRQHGTAAHQRALDEFSAEVVQQRHFDYLLDQLARVGSPLAKND